MIAVNKIKDLQKYSQFIAFLVLIIFVALIGYSIIKLKSINSEISAAQVGRDKIRAEGDALKQENLALEKRNAALKTENFELIQYGSKANEKIAKTDPAGAKELVERSFVPTIYIQAYNKGQVGRVSQIAETLQREGYLIPGIEPRPNKVTATEVFYFHEEDKQEAEKLADLLRGEGVRDAEAKPAPEKYFGTVKRRQYEIWFSAQAF